MTKLRSIPFAVLCVALFVSAALFSPAAIRAASAARITAPIDETQLVTLSGNTHPAANSKNDQGPVAPDLRMTDLILVLSRSPQQQAAFDAFVASQDDKSSPNYHHWLTPEEIGEQYGPAPADIATISTWLGSHGFSVDQVTPDKMTIRFSGTAAQVQSAFHTQIHNYSVHGAAHIANMSDPQIPAALAPVIFGIKSLHNFFPRPLHRLGSVVTQDPATGKWKRPVPSAVTSATATNAAPSPQAIRDTVSGNAATASTPHPLFGVNGCASTTSPCPSGDSYLVEDVDPWDFAAIYNVLPLWNASTPIDGTGQTIAIAGTSDIDVGQSGETGANGNNDVLTFRTLFGLPTTNAANTPMRISGNSQPLTVCSDTTGKIPYASNPCGVGDLIENSLDVEWSGSVAKNAQIILVASYPASATDDTLYDSESYIVTHLTAHIMNVSYGACELGLGTAGNVEYYNLWQQAKAEGISVFVSSGDSGSASCDDGNSYAVSGQNVSGIASTPFNTAVGGTDFNWCNPDTADGTGTAACSASPYWSSSPIASTGSPVAVTTALGYIPETPWNESCANPLTLKLMQDVFNSLYSAYGYVASDVTNTEQGCNFILDESYTGYSNGVPGLGTLAPGFEGLLQVVGGSGGPSNCIVGNPVATTVEGETQLSGCTAGATSTGPTTNPTTGASQASISLVNNGWPKPAWQSSVTGIPNDGVRDIPDVSFFASDGFISSSAYLFCVSANNAGGATCSYSTTSEPTTEEVGGTSVSSPIMASVMALINQKTGSPQGLANQELYTLAATQGYSYCSSEGVSATGSGCLFYDIDQGNNSAPCDALDLTPNCTATSSTLGYADSKQLGLLTGYNAGAGYDLATGLGSLNIANVVNAWASDAGTGSTTIALSPGASTITINQPLSETVSVTSSGSPTPTGAVTLSGGGYSVTQTIGASPCTSNTSCAFTIPANTFAAGSGIVLTAYYSGDTKYAANSKTAAINVNQMTPTVTVSASNGNVANPLPVTVTITGPTGSVAVPSGTVSLSGGGYSVGGVALSGGTATITIPANSLSSGSDLLTVTYGGDANYTGGNGTKTVTISSAPTLTPTVTVTPSPASPQYSGETLSVAVKVTGSAATPTGTVTLSAGSYTSAATTLAGGSASFTVPANSLAVATDSITASYSGDSTYLSGSGAGTVTVTQSTFTVTPGTPSSASVTPGSSVTVPITGSQSATLYSGTINFTTCSLTSGSNSGGAISCSLSGGPITYTLGTPTGTVTATVSTSAATSELVYPKLRPGFGNGSGWEGAGGLALAILVFFGVPARRREWRAMFGMLILLAALATLSACGGSGSGGGSTGTPATSAGTYTFTVTGSATPSIGTAPTTTFNITVN